MSNDLNVSEICSAQHEILEQFRIPNKMVKRMKHASDDQMEIMRDVMGLLGLQSNERDFGPKSIMAFNIGILSVVIQDLLKNFNFSAQGYNKNDPAHQKLIDSICKVINTQTNTLKAMKDISLIGAPSLHLHQHAKGIPSFKEGAVVIMDKAK